MTSKEKFLTDSICDMCKKEFTDYQRNSCPSENPVMPIFVGFKEGLIHVRIIGYDLGDMCKSCQHVLFSLIKDKFPHARYVKEND